jgi:type I restriction enzyme, R subunit
MRLLRSKPPLYESPFTDISPSRPEGLFTSQEVEELVGILDKIRDAAAAA